MSAGRLYGVREFLFSPAFRNSRVWCEEKKTILSSPTVRGFLRCVLLFLVAEGGDCSEWLKSSRIGSSSANNGNGKRKRRPVSRPFVQGKKVSRVRSANCCATVVVVDWIIGGINNRGSFRVQWQLLSSTNSQPTTVVDCCCQSCLFANPTESSQ